MGASQTHNAAHFLYFPFPPHASPNMRTRPLETMLAGSAARLRPDQPSKAEKVVNAVGMYLDILSTANINSSYLGDKVAAFSESQTVTTRQNILTSPDFAAAASQVSHLSNIAGSWLTCWTRRARCTHSFKVCHVRPRLSLL